MHPAGQPQRRIGLRRPAGSNPSCSAPAARTVAIPLRSDAEVLAELFIETQAPHLHQSQPLQELQLENEEIDLYPSQLPQLPRQMEGVNEPVEKRPRNEDSGEQGGNRPPPSLGESSIESELLTTLSTIPVPQLVVLRKCLSRMHSARLDNARQIAKMRLRSEQGLAPHGWRMQTLHLPSGSEEHEESINEKLMQAYTECYDDLIKARDDANDNIGAQIMSKKKDESEAQMSLISTVINGNPSRYPGYKDDDMRERVNAQITDALARAEAEADIKAAKSERIRTEKAQKTRDAEEEKRAAATRAERNLTVSDMQSMMDKHRQEIEDTFKSSISKFKSEASKSLKRTGQTISTKSRKSVIKKKGHLERRDKRLTPISGGEGGKSKKGGKGKNTNSSSSATTSNKRGQSTSSEIHCTTNRENGSHLSKRAQ